MTEFIWIKKKKVAWTQSFPDLPFLRRTILTCICTFPVTLHLLLASDPIAKHNGDFSALNKWPSSVNVALITPLFLNPLPSLTTRIWTLAVWYDLLCCCLQGDHKLVLTHRWQFLRLTGVKCLELCLAQNTFSIHGLSLPLGRKQNSQSNPLSLPSSFDVWNWPLNYVEFRGANPQAVENYNFWHSKTLNSP